MATQGIGSAVVLNVIFWLGLLISIPLNGVNRLYGFAALLGRPAARRLRRDLILLTRGQRHADDWLRRVAGHVPFLDPDRVSDLLQQVADRDHDLDLEPQAPRLGAVLGGRRTGCSTRPASGSSCWPSARP